MSITSVSSIMSKKTRSNIANFAYLYYTFEVADITCTDALYRAIGESRINFL